MRNSYVSAAKLIKNYGLFNHEMRILLASLHSHVSHSCMLLFFSYRGVIFFPLVTFILNLVLGLIHSVIESLVTRITRQRRVWWPQTQEKFIVHFWWISIIAEALYGKRVKKMVRNTRSFFFFFKRKKFLLTSGWKANNIVRIR